MKAINKLQLVEDPIEETVEDEVFYYIKIDWFDNGEHKPGTKRTIQHKIKIHFQYTPDSETHEICGKICKANRNWKNAIDLSDPFYGEIWDWFNDFIVGRHAPTNGADFDVRPMLGHIYDMDQNRIPGAVMMLTKVAGDPAIVKLWLGDIAETYRLDIENPGKFKVLKATYMHKRSTKREKVAKLDFASAFPKQ